MRNKNNGISKSKKNTRELVGAKAFNDYGIETYSNDIYVYFQVKPINISVLSDANVTHKINSLTELLKGNVCFEIMCLSSRENFEENKAFIKKRISEETEENVLNLLRKDSLYFDNIQIQTASAREFLFILKFNERQEKEIYLTINTFLKTAKEKGFMIKEADTIELQKIMSVYYSQDIMKSRFDMFDGELYNA